VADERGTDDVVTIRFSASTDRVRLARTLVATLADEAGFDYDDVEDLRIAVDELCFVLLDSTPGPGHLELIARGEPGRLEVEGCCTASATRLDVLDELPQLTSQILATVVDEYEVGLDGGRARFRFHKSKL
jgi:hypothetical protein